MLASSSILSRFASRLFGVGRRRARSRCRGSALRRRERTLTFSTADVMEERVLLSATFGAALNLGNDVGASQIRDVATDAAGNSYVAGFFGGTVDFDPGASHVGDTDILSARGSGDAFVAKYAADNSLLWVQRMGGDATVDPGAGITDAARRIAIDGSGNVYVAGDFQGSADFGATTLVSAGGSDGFAVKFNAGGTIQWAKRWGGSSADQAGGIGVDSSGNVYTFGVRPFDGYNFQKFNAGGTAIWNKSIVTGGFVISGDMAVDGSGNLFAVGAFSGTVDFDPGPKTVAVDDGAGSHGAFTLKLTKDGKFSWVTPFTGQATGGTTGYSTALSVALDGSGNVIVGGYYGNTVDFNPGSGTTTLPTRGGFITKLNSSGGLTWARALESDDSTFVYGLATDMAGNIYATGTFFGAVDLNPGAGLFSRTTSGANDIFILKLDAGGNFAWAETFGSGATSGSEVGWGIAVEPSGKLHIAGAFQESADFDPDPVGTYYLNAGSFTDAFLLELGQV